MRRGIHNLRRPVQMAALVLFFLAPLSPAVAQPESDAERIRSVVEQDFRVLPIRDGWLFEPLDESLGIQTVEAQAGDFAIDGVSVSEDELRARLGALAGVVIEFAGLDAASDAQPDPDRAESTAEEAAEVEDSDSSDSEEEAHEDRDKSRHERRGRGRHRTDAQVVVGNSMTVEEDEVFRDVVVFGGRLTVDGKVLGDAVTIGGSASVSGEITGDLAVVGGSIELEDGAIVLGDVVSVGGSIEKGENVEVSGQIVEVPFAPSFAFGNLKNWSWDWDSDSEPAFAPHLRRSARWFGFFDAGWELVGVLFCALLACLVLVVARNPVERVAWKAGVEPLKAGLVGLLTQILCLPALALVCFLLLISIVGIPLLLLIPFVILGFILVAFLGYTSVAYRIGGWTEDRFGWNFGNPYVNLLVGIGFIEIWALTGEFLSWGPGPIKFFAFMFGLFGCVLIYLAWTVGLGAAILTRVGTWDDLGGPGASAPSDPESPPIIEPDWDLTEDGAEASSAEVEPLATEATPPPPPIGPGDR